MHIIDVNPQAYAFVLLGLIIIIPLMGLAFLKCRSMNKILGLILLLVSTGVFSFICCNILHTTYLYLFNFNAIAGTHFLNLGSASLFFTFMFGLGLRGFFGKSLSDIVEQKSMLSKFIYAGFTIFLFCYLVYLIVSFNYFLGSNFKATPQIDGFKFVFNALGFFILFKVMFETWHFKKNT